MRKRMIIAIALILCCSVLLVSCGGSSPKIPSWLQGTWTCSDTEEKAVFTADNFTFYNKWNNETANISNLLEEAKSEGAKVGIKNSSSGNTYTLSVINKDTKMKIDFSFTKNSDNEFSYLGYKFTK